MNGSSWKEGYCWKVSSVEGLSIPLLGYLHSNRPHLKAPRLKTCCMLAYRLPYVRALITPAKQQGRLQMSRLISYLPLSSDCLPPVAGVCWRQPKKERNGVEWWNGCRGRYKEMRGKKGDAQRKRRERGHLGKLERGDGKERKDERAGECTGMKKKEQNHNRPASGKRQTRHILSPDKNSLSVSLFHPPR